MHTIRLVVKSMVVQSVFVWCRFLKFGSQQGYMGEDLVLVFRIREQVWTVLPVAG